MANSRDREEQRVLLLAEQALALVLAERVLTAERALAQAKAGLRVAILALLAS